MKNVSISIFAFIIALSAQAYDRSATIDGVTWYYDLHDDNGVKEAWISSEQPYYGGQINPDEEVSTYKGNLIIPSVIDGYVVVGISPGAFSYCKELESVILPDTICTIGWSSFVYCDSLASIIMTDNVSVIGMDAFCGCSSLTNVNLSKNTKSVIGFAGCSSLRSIYVPVGVTSIASEAFAGCESLKNVNIPCGVRSIGYSAFTRCSQLSSVSIPKSLTTIYSGAFAECYSLATILVDIGDAERVRKLLINSGLDVSSLDFVEQEQTKKSNGYEYVVAEDEVYILDSGILSDNVMIPSDIEGRPVTTIMNLSGTQLSYPETITIPQTIKYIYDGAFRNCTPTQEFFVDGENEEYAVVDNFLMSKDGKKLISIPKLHNSITRIPDGVERLSDYMFGESWCFISEITIPKSVEQIGAEAFYGCNGLRRMDFEGKPCSTIPRLEGLIRYNALYDEEWKNELTFNMSSGQTFLPYLPPYIADRIGNALSEIPSAITITNIVVHCVLNSVQTEFAKPVSEDTGFVNVITEVKGNNIAVPETWSDTYPKFKEIFGNNFAVALTRKSGKIAAGGREMLVWEDYVAGTDPTNPNDKFTASVTIVDGKPVVSYTPELDSERAALRKYTTYGKVKLTADEWTVVEDGHEDEYNFFKVTVEMK